MQSTGLIAPHPTALTRRALGPDDLDAVMALHLAATAAVGRPDLIRPESRDFFEALIAGGGWLAGVVDAEGLLAYGVLQWDLPPAENLRPLLGLSPEAPFAKLAGASVRPGCWGSGLHEELIAIRVAEARRRGLRHLYATSAPGNARSWENLIAQGFAVRGLVEQYGGNMRYILYQTADAQEAPASAGTWCDTADIARQRELLASGLMGVEWRRGGNGGREICWHPIP